MSGVALFLISVAVYAVFPLLYTLRRTRFQFLLLYAHIAAVLTIGGVLNAAYVLPIFGDVALLAGQVAYGGFMFSTLVTMIVGRDLQVVRNVIALTVTVDVVNFLMFRLSTIALKQGIVPNPFNADPALLGQSLRVLVVGGILIIGELLGLMALLELAKRRLGAQAMAAVYVLAFVGVLTLDGVLFPSLVLLPSTGLGQFITAGVEAKLVLAAAFSVPLLVFVALNRAAVDRFEQTPINLGDLVNLSRDPLHERLAESTALSGRREAMIVNLLDAATSTAMVAVDNDMVITHVNRGAENLLGRSREYLLGRTPAAFHTPEELARQARALGTSADPAAVVRAAAEYGAKREWRFSVADGSVRTVSLDVSAILGDDGETLGYLCAGEDVTDQLRAQALLTEALQHEREAVARLEAADRVKDELVSTVSHELRTPITSIHGYTELLADEMLGDLRPEQLEALAKVQRNTSRLSTLVEDLLLVAKTDGERLRLRTSIVDLREVVIGAREPLSQQLPERDLEVAFELPPAPVLVRCDGNAIERVVLNLVGNAVKFTPDGGRVVVSLNGHGDEAVLTVADTGIGIVEADLPQLFTRFFRAADAYERAIPGTGLGLSVVDAIVRSHEGRIEVDSTPGAGTTVTVRLARVSRTDDP